MIPARVSTAAYRVGNIQLLLLVTTYQDSVWSTNKYQNIANTYCAVPCGQLMGPSMNIMLDKVNKRIFQDKVNINSSDGTKQ